MVYGCTGPKQEVACFGLPCSMHVAIIILCSHSLLGSFPFNNFCFNMKLYISVKPFKFWETSDKTKGLQLPCKQVRWLHKNSLYISYAWSIIFVLTNCCCYCTFPMNKANCTCLSLQRVFLYQLQSKSEFQHSSYSHQQMFFQIHQNPPLFSSLLFQKCFCFTKSSLRLFDHFWFAMHPSEKLATIIATYNA